jgi:hypothetical protein
MEVKKKVCDECKKEVLLKNDWDTPFKWYRLAKIYATHRTTRASEIPKRNIIDISEYSSADPDFCSKECFIKWITKRINRL